MDLHDSSFMRAGLRSICPSLNQPYTADAGRQQTIASTLAQSHDEKAESRLQWCETSSEDEQKAMRSPETPAAWTKLQLKLIDVAIGEFLARRQSHA